MQTRAVTLFFGVLVLLSAARAGAAEPACFPERSTHGWTSLEDAHGHPLGYLGEGEVVRVLDDQVGAGQRSADVQIDGALSFHARLPRHNLRLFVAHDVPIGSPGAWWTAGTRLRVISGDRRRANVELAGSSRVHVTIDCAHLTAHRAPAWNPGCCSETTQTFPSPGPTVWWEDERSVDVDLGPEMKTQPLTYRVGTLLDRRGDEVLLEIFSPRGAIRVQRWVSARGMHEEPHDWGTVGYADHGVIERGWEGLPGGVLPHPVGVRAEPGEPAFASLPAGTRIRVTDVQGGRAQIRASWPERVDEDHGLHLFGWASVMDLPPFPDWRDRRFAIEGHVRIDAGGTSPPLSGISLFADDGTGPRRVSLGADGGFRFVLPSDKETAQDAKPTGTRAVRLEARDARGEWLGLVAEGRAFPGGGGDVIVSLSPAVEVSGRLETELGKPIAHRRIAVGSTRALPSAVTGSDGSFRLRVPPGEQPLCIDRGDACDWVTAQRPLHDVTLHIH
ncbi:MAG TPA: hypothetical protein VN962_26955 [Polyangia bacterium]|nr:hypothetical protein [Polyangia bacterium]